MTNLRFVLDTNVIISATLLEHSIPDKALKKAENTGAVLYSDATLTELSQVIQRPKFLRYLSAEKGDALLSRIHSTWKKIHITHRIRICRDPKDDMFLELAMNGEANMLITGDRDLLALVPYRQLDIITPADFL